MQKIKVNKALDLGSNLRELRKENGYTQDQLVAQLYTKYNIDLTRNYYSRIETGELNIPVCVLVALHDLYSCPYDDFFHNLSIR